ncbi:MAG: hypothetical protein WCR69_07300 [Sulfuricurvum sp.]
MDISLWRKYNDSNNFRQLLELHTKLDPLELIADDTELYSALKRKLTKKELKLFAMDAGKLPDGAMMGELGLDASELENAKFKLYKKLKQDKTKMALKSFEAQEEF